MAELLHLAKSTLLEQGMADMEEYGDMLKWGLPKDGACRNLHVFHPDWCSFDDRYKGTIHYHGGWIKGTILLGGFEHLRYEATLDPDGDRLHAGVPHRLTPQSTQQAAGTSYELPAMVPHWLKPTGLTLTYFEEEDTERMGDLIEPIGMGHDEHTWTQADAEALMPELLARIDAQLEALLPVTTPA